MPEFENYAAEALQIEQEIERKGAILGIDWNNESAVRNLAKQAMASHDATMPIGFSMSSPEGMAKIELFGLAQLMLKVMKQSAEDDVLAHGGPVWKIFGKALWAEHKAQQ